MQQIEELLRVMMALRDPKTGCPWDLRQSFRSLIPHTLEEAYEVADAIESGDLVELKYELGDLLFQVVFYAQLAQEAGLFTFDDVVAGITEKIIHRHPHVFENTVYADVHEQTRAWEDLKRKEMAARGIEAVGALEGVSKALPALARAVKIQKRASQVGFDWNSTAPVIAKVDEELSELKTSVEQGDEQDRWADELGDLLFSCVNLGRHLGLDPEQVLRNSTRKFEHRFQQVETRVKADGRELKACTEAELDALWERVKKEEDRQTRSSLSHPRPR